ncbi:MAG: hypothetical protein GY820_28560 [Gammaproteobacteria bacterium]|nr:hypothetical protein [Gammaproteobacteria bacterium]
MYNFFPSDALSVLGVVIFGILADFSRYRELNFFPKILNRDLDRASRDRLDLQHVARGHRPRRLSGAEGALPSACFSRQEPRDAIASPVWANYAARVARDATASRV